jgi:hypothetical protein
MAASMCAPLRRGPRPHPPTGGDNEAIKANESKARRQVALTVSPVEATTSVVGSLTSGGDHLSTDDSGHLCTGGLPATMAASARPKRSSLLSSYGSEDKTIQERGHCPHGVRRLVRPPQAASEQCGRWRGRSRGCGGPAHDQAVDTPRPGGRRQRRRRHQSHPGQGAKHAAADGACSRPASCSRSSPPPRGW